MNIHNTIFAGTQEKSFLGSKYRLKLAVKKKNGNNITKIVINKWIKRERERKREKMAKTVCWSNVRENERSGLTGEGFK